MESRRVFFVAQVESSSLKSFLSLRQIEAKGREASSELSAIPRNVPSHGND